MPIHELWYGAGRIPLDVPDHVEVHTDPHAEPPLATDPLSTIANAIDAPIGMRPLRELAKGKAKVAIVIPDPTRPPIAQVALLPLLSRLALAGVGPERLRIVVARGIHPAAPRDRIEHLVGSEMMRVLRPVQSAPESPDWNATLADFPGLGPVRIHRQVADADLVVLVGIVTPHHLAGFGGGAKALVPGVAERETVLAAHRLTLDSLVKPDGSIRPTWGQTTPNRFRKALTRIAQTLPCVFGLNLLCDAAGGIHAATAGDIEASHTAAAEQWYALRGLSADGKPNLAEMTVTGVESPRADTVIQAHKALLHAASVTKKGGPILWLAEAKDGPGHPSFLPWFEAGKLPRHLAALRERFHPYGLTAYSVRRIAKDHPVHVVSKVSGDVLRPMGLHVHATAQHALDHALKSSGAQTIRLLARG